MDFLKELNMCDKNIKFTDSISSFFRVFFLLLIILSIWWLATSNSFTSGYEYDTSVEAVFKLFFTNLFLSVVLSLSLSTLLIERLRSFAMDRNTLRMPSESNIKWLNLTFFYHFFFSSFILIFHEDMPAVKKGLLYYLFILVTIRSFCYFFNIIGILKIKWAKKALKQFLGLNIIFDFFTAGAIYITFGTTGAASFNYRYIYLYISIANFTLIPAFIYLGLKKELWSLKVPKVKQEILYSLPNIFQKIWIVFLIIIFYYTCGITLMINLQKSLRTSDKREYESVESCSESISILESSLNNYIKSRGIDSEITDFLYKEIDDNSPLIKYGFLKCIRCCVPLGKKYILVRSSDSKHISIKCQIHGSLEDIDHAKKNLLKKNALSLSSAYRKLHIKILFLCLLFSAFLTIRTRKAQIKYKIYGLTKAIDYRLAGVGYFFLLCHICYFDAYFITYPKNIGNPPLFFSKISITILIIFRILFYLYFYFNFIKPYLTFTRISFLENRKILYAAGAIVLTDFALLLYYFSYNRYGMGEAEAFFYVLAQLAGVILFYFSVSYQQETSHE